MTAKIGPKELTRRALRERKLPMRKRVKVQSAPKIEPPDEPDSTLVAAALFGRMGGLARSKALSAKRKSEIARLGGKARAAKLK